jgi:hypothetical protein
VHGSAYLGKRHLLALESHNPATMGKALIPGNVIVDAIVAGNWHDA